MSRRDWLATGLLGLLAVVFAGAAVAGAQQLTDANDRKDNAEARLAEVQAANQPMLTELAAEQNNIEGVEEELADLRLYFTADTIAAVNQVQAQMREGSCEQARTATREAADPPEAQAVVDYALTAAQEHGVLGDLGDRWASFLVPTAIEEEIEACAADELAVIEAEQAAALDAERARNCGAPLFPEDACPTDAELAAEQLAERLCGGGRYDEAAAEGIDCGVPPPPPQTFGAIGPLVDLCLAGDPAACAQLADMGVPGF